MFLALELSIAKLALCTPNFALLSQVTIVSSPTDGKKSKSTIAVDEFLIFMLSKELVYPSVDMENFPQWCQWLRVSLRKQQENGNPVKNTAYLNSWIFSFQVHIDRSSSCESKILYHYIDFFASYQLFVCFYFLLYAFI